MNKTDAIRKIAAIDKRIDAARRAKDRVLEDRLFEIRGWYQLVRDTAGERWAKRDHEKAVAKVAELSSLVAA